MTYDSKIALVFLLGGIAGVVCVVAREHKLEITFISIVLYVLAKWVVI